MDNTCIACATGLEEYIHNFDPNSCRQGYLENLESLSLNNQLKELEITERLSPDILVMTRKLCVERKQSAVKVLTEEGFLVYVRK